MHIDIKYTNRKSNQLKGLIRQAKLEQPDPSITSIDYQSGLKLNKTLISRLENREYITEHCNISITNAIGSGKTHIAYFGMETYKHCYSVNYIRLPDLLPNVQASKDSDIFVSVLKNYPNLVLLFINEQFLSKLTVARGRNLFNPIYKRRKKPSTIFYSQIWKAEWYQQICSEKSTLAR